MLKRSLSILRRQHGDAHPSVATALNNLALIAEGQRQFSEAEKYILECISVRTKNFGSEHFSVGSALLILAAQYQAQEHHADAENELLRGVSILSRSLGSDHAAVGKGVSALADLYQVMGRAKEALYKRALVIWQRELGADHILLVQPISNLARIYVQLDNMESAVQHWRRAADVLIQRMQRGISDDEVGSGLAARGELRRSREIFMGAIKSAFALASVRAARNESLSREMFELVQRVSTTEAAISLAQMAARGAARSPRLAGMVRER